MKYTGKYGYQDLEALISKVLADMGITVSPGLYKEDAVELLCMIAAHESHAGRYRKQINGPALGIYQIEPVTHDSIWDTSDLIKDVMKVFGYTQDAERMVYDDKYSTIMARLYLAQDVNALPDRYNLQEMAEYSKSYWNRTGAATPESYYLDYVKFLRGEI